MLLIPSWRIAPFFLIGIINDERMKYIVNLLAREECAFAVEKDSVH